MTPFLKCFIPESEMQNLIRDHIAAWESGDYAYHKLVGDEPNEAKRRIEQHVRESAEGDIWKNDSYQVVARNLGALTHLSIRRLDREAIHDWRELQEIKNELVGPENEGVELYPAESRLVDAANQYHLWVFNDPTYRIPFGFDEGRVTSDSSVGKSVQRPRTKTNT